MVGNDVVDLEDSETDFEALNPRFDRRVFSCGELQRLAEVDETSTLRWSLWAAKESAFKLARRRDPETIFAHSQFITTLDETGKGVVSYREWRCAVDVSCSGRVVHAVAIPEHDDRHRVVTAVNVIPPKSDPSLMVREFAIASIACHLGIQPACVTIINRIDRVPILKIDDQPRGSLSMSHHGELVAFAWTSVNH